MYQELSGLIVKDPDFYFRHKDPVYLSQINFGKNTNKEIAVIGGPKSEATVHGVIKLKKAIKVTDIEDIADRIPNSVFVQMKDRSGDFYVYPVVRVKEFDPPKAVIDGLANGQQLWVKEVKFQRMLAEDFRQLELSELQSMHDKIHAYTDDSKHTEEIFLSHYFIANNFKKAGMKHPVLDSLDWEYELLYWQEKFKDSEFEDFEDLLTHMECPKSKNLIKAIALNLREEYTDTKSTNTLLTYAGRWTPDIVKNWLNYTVTENQVEKIAQKANELFRTYLNAGSAPGHALQMSISKAVAYGDKYNE